MSTGHNELTLCFQVATEAVSISENRKQNATWQALLYRNNQCILLLNHILFRYTLDTLYRLFLLQFLFRIEVRHYGLTVGIATLLFCVEAKALCLGRELFVVLFVPQVVFSDLSTVPFWSFLVVWIFQKTWTWMVKWLNHLFHQEIN